LDLVRAFERACRRAALPLYYSEGFNPRPRIVFALPLRVGVIGLRELVEVYLRVPVQPEALKTRLASALPEGLSLESVRRVPREAPALMAAVDRATYHVDGQIGPEVTQESVRAGLQAVLGAGEIKSIRRSKDGSKERSIRSGIISLDARCNAGGLNMDMTLQAGQQGNVRPEEVVEAFLRLGGFSGDPLDFTYYRTGLFTLTSDRMVRLG
jgi:radical SAM-linked protein